MFYIKQFFGPNIPLKMVVGQVNNGGLVAELPTGDVISGLDTFDVDDLLDMAEVSTKNLYTLS
jgi:hypothetical protein